MKRIHLLLAKTKKWSTRSVERLVQTSSNGSYLRLITVKHRTIRNDQTLPFFRISILFTLTVDIACGNLGNNGFYSRLGQVFRIREPMEENHAKLHKIDNHSIGYSCDWLLDPACEPRLCMIPMSIIPSGKGTDVVSPHAKPDKRNRAMEEAVTKILAPFPPQPKE